MPLSPLVFLFRAVRSRATGVPGGPAFGRLGWAGAVRTARNLHFAAPCFNYAACGLYPWSFGTRSFLTFPQPSTACDEPAFKALSRATYLGPRRDERSSPHSGSVVWRILPCCVGRLVLTGCMEVSGGEWGIESRVPRMAYRFPRNPPLDRHAILFRSFIVLIIFSMI